MLSLGPALHNSYVSVECPLRYRPYHLSESARTQLISRLPSFAPTRATPLTIPMLSQKGRPLTPRQENMQNEAIIITRDKYSSFLHLHAGYVFIQTTSAAQGKRATRSDFLSCSGSLQKVPNNVVVFFTFTYLH